MEDYIAIAEDQLDQWRQTGQKDLLHRGLAVLTSQLQEQSQAQTRHNEIMTELKVHRERFEAIDKRFETMDKRFSQMSWTIGIGFTLIVSLMTLYNFL